MRVAAFCFLKSALSYFLLSFQLEIGEMTVKLALLLLSSLLNGELDIMCYNCDQAKFGTKYNLGKNGLFGDD